jgi:hypothetical protein
VKLSCATHQPFSQFQELVVLHELSHLMDSFGNYDDAKDEKRGRELNKELKENCF